MNRVPSAASAIAAEAQLSNREIAALFLPLALTSTMMSISVPIINAGLARLPDPASNLAAFGLAFGLSIFLESPVFALQQAVVAWYAGGPIRPLVVFCGLVGLLMAAVMGLVAFTPLGHAAFSVLLGAPADLVDPALHALRIAVLFPVLVAVRSAYQGILVLRRNSAPIAWGTFLRLVLLGGSVAWICPRLPLEPAAGAMAALAGAVFLETLYVAWVTLRTPPRDLAPSPAHREGRDTRARLRFVGPLALTMVLGSLTNPLIHAFISRSPEPRDALAVYSVVASLIWFLASSSLRYSSVTIALGTSDVRRRRLGGFLWRFVGGVTLVVLLVILTPARNLVVDRFLGLPPDLASRVDLPLLLLALQPLIAAFIAYHQGVLTRAARTRAVGLGGMARLAAILGLGLVLLPLGASGEVLGSLLLGASFIGELAALLILRRRKPAAGPALAGPGRALVP